MADININFIPKSREYLQKFISSNYQQFFHDMGEYRPQKGYGNFPNSSEIVQCMREITHILDEEFADLSIPENFTSPDDLINRAKKFVAHLVSFEKYFKDTIDKYIEQKKESMIPAPVIEIDKNRLKTITVFENFIKLANLEKQEEKELTKSMDKFEKIENLIEKFHNVVSQIQNRRNEGGVPRPTIKINDEYDVQDLLHGLLRIYFDDIRPEEWNPSYAGSSKRSDFLLKDEKVIIEVKKTRTNLKDKDVGEQLIIDIANYKNHADCDTLICFVYDPDGFIINPRGLENDLKSEEKNFKVKVYIRPR